MELVRTNWTVLRRLLFLDFSSLSYPLSLPLPPFIYLPVSSSICMFHQLHCTLLLYVTLSNLFISAAFLPLPSADLSRELIVALKANLFRCQSLFLATAGDRSTPLKLLSVSSVCPPQWCSLGETRCSHASRHHWVKSSRYRKWS